MKLTLDFLFCNLFLIYSVQSAVIPQDDDDGELIQVSVIIRHGARTTYSFYPTDPNKNETFYPFGLGGLTNEGKMGEFKVGTYLKGVYGKFLGEDYTEEEVYARSTDVTRTKMSAQLALAGLFPPSKLLLWNSDLMWQPIPVSYKSEAEEDLFHPWKTCPYKAHVIAQQPKMPEVCAKYIAPYMDTMNFIEEKSGKPIKTPADMQDIFIIFQIESDMGLVVPEWTKKVYPEPSQGIAAQVYGYHNFDPKVKQINSGYMLKKILDEAKAKMEGNSTKKIFLYSGHESTVGYMLNALGVEYETHVPPYGSAISFEVRRKEDQHFIKLRYRNDPEATEPADLKLLGCDVLCPFEKFLELQKDLIPQITIQEACKIDREQDNKIDETTKKDLL